MADTRKRPLALLREHGGEVDGHRYRSSRSILISLCRMRLIAVVSPPSGIAAILRDSPELQQTLARAHSLLRRAIVARFWGALHYPVWRKGS
jgi:hypothetical protein